MNAITLSTKRLLLRPWKTSDFAPFAAMNQDPRVMRFFPKTLSREESDTLAEKLRLHLEQNPYGLWAVELFEEASFIGFVGIHKPVFEAAFMPCVEIGWRLAYPYWGKGYAKEAAIRALQYAFTTLAIPEIVSFASAINARSIGLMKRLGMQRNPEEDFLHPDTPKGHILSPHVLYRLSKKQFAKRRPG